MFNWLFKKREKKVILTVDNCSIPNSYMPYLKIGEVHGKVYKPNGWDGFRLITDDGKEFANVYSEQGINSTRWYGDMDLHGKEFVAIVEYFNEEHHEYGLTCRNIKIFE